MEGSTSKVPLLICLAQPRPLQPPAEEFGEYDEATQMSENGAVLSGTTNTGATSPGDSEHDGA
jgi:hypothetical protein